MPNSGRWKGKRKRTRIRREIPRARERNSKDKRRKDKADTHSGGDALITIPLRLEEKIYKDHWYGRIH